MLVTPTLLSAFATAFASSVQEAGNEEATKANQESLVWPEGTTVSGRVVDNRGMAVENACDLRRRDRSDCRANAFVWQLPAKDDGVDTGA